MLEQLQKSLGVARRVRVMVTDRLTSPAVAGVLLPVLILPGSLLTALTPEQLRFILLHELAHIRRGIISSICVSCWWRRCCFSIRPCGG